MDANQCSFLSFVYICIAVGDPVTKGGGGGGGLDLINRFKPDTFLCLSKARSGISEVVYHGLFYLWRVKMRGDWSFC